MLIPVMIALLTAYLPNSPALKASPKTLKSQVVGSERGSIVISWFVLSAESAIHNKGMK